MWVSLTHGIPKGLGQMQNYWAGIQTMVNLINKEFSSDSQSTGTRINAGHVMSICQTDTKEDKLPTFEIMQLDMKKDSRERPSIVICTRKAAGSQPSLSEEGKYMEWREITRAMMRLEEGEKNKRGHGVLQLNTRGDRKKRFGD